MYSGIVHYFLGDEKAKIEKMLRQNKIDPGKWAMQNIIAGILIAIFASVLFFYVGLEQAYSVAAFPLIAALPLLMNFLWQNYKAEVRRKNIDSCCADLLFYASSLPKGMPTQKIIKKIAEAGYGPLSEEFGKAASEIEKGVSIPEALQRIAERNESLALKRATSMLAEAYSSGAEMKDAFREVAKDLMETEGIIRERLSSMIIERYTLLISAGIILPCVLAMVAKLVNGLDFGMLESLEIGLSAEARSSLFGAAAIAMPVYIAEYSLLASFFVAFQEGMPKKAFIYAVLLMPLSLAIHFFIRGF